MRHILSALTLLLSISPAILTAAERLDTATKTVLFNVGSTSNISFRFHRDDSSEYVSSFRLQANHRSNDHRRPDDDTVGGKCFYSNKYTFADLDLYGGLRFNTPQKSLTWFYQPEIGLVASYQSNTYSYNGGCIFSSGNKSDSLSYGLGAKFSAGATYFITPEISLEGSAGFNGSYLKWNTENDYKREDWRINSFAVVQVGYHW